MDQPVPVPVSCKGAFKTVSETSMANDEKRPETILSELQVLNSILTALIDERNRKSQSGKLAGSERDFIDVILDAAGALAVVYDQDGKIICFNRACEETTGLLPRDVIGKFVWDLSPTPKEEQKIRKEFDGLKSGRRATTFETYWRGKGGRNHLIAWEHTVLTEAKGGDGYIIGLGIDITNHRETEENLRESEEKYRKLIETANDAIFIADAETGVILDINTRASQLLGLPAEEIIGRHQHWLHPKEEVLKYRAIFKEAVKRGGGTYNNLVLARKDGSRIPVDISASVTELSGKKVIQGIFRDISDRIEAEDALIRSERRYRELVETMNEGLGMTDRDYVLTFVNEKFCEMLGYTREEMIGRHLLTFIHDDSKALMSEQIRLRKQGEEKSFEVSFRTKSGQKISTQVSPRAFFDTEGRFTGSLGVLTDITGRIEVEEELKKSTNRYHGLFEEAPISLWEEDASDLKRYLDTLKKQGVEDFKSFFVDNPKELAYCQGLVRVTDVNKYTLSLYRAENKEELLGNLEKVMAPESLDVFRDLLVAFAEGRTSFETETMNRTLDGEKIDIQLRISIAPGYEETFSRILVSVTDITLKKAADRTIRESNERLDAFFTDAPAGLAIVDSQMKISKINDTLARIYGSSREESIGKHVDEVIPELTPVIGPIYRQILNTGKPVLNMEVTGEVQSTPGVKRHWTFSAFPIPGSDGKPSEVGFIVVENTGQKEAEEIVSRKSQVNEALADLSRTLLKQTTIEEISILVLNHSKHLTGSEIGYVGYVDETTGALVCPAVTGKSWDRGRVMENGSPNDTFTGLCKLSLEMGVPLFSNDLPRENPKGDVTGAWGDIRRFLKTPAILGDRPVGAIFLANAGRDYSEEDVENMRQVAAIYAIAIARRQAEEALRLSERHYRTLAESSLDFIFIISRDMTVQYMNSSGAQFLRRNLEEIVGKRLDELYPQSISKAMGKNLETVFATGEPAHIIDRFELPQGPWWIDTRLMPLMGDSGAVNEVLAITRDISEREKMKEELESTRKIESVRILAGSIARDFENLLTNILSHIEEAKLHADTKELILKNLSEAERISLRAQRLAHRLSNAAKGKDPAKTSGTKQKP